MPFFLLLLCLELGLDAVDRKMLTAMIETFRGGPVGLDTLAAAISESTDTVEDVFEPFLIQLGFINRTPRGRVVTRAGNGHMGVPCPDDASPYAPMGF